MSELSTTRTLSQPHLLGIDGLTRADIELILQTAKSFQEVNERAVKKVPALRGLTVVNLFFEASTRTRMSFELKKEGACIHYEHNNCCSSREIEYIPCRPT